MCEPTSRTPRFFGYFEGASLDPSYDPGDSVPCLFCMNPLAFGTGTIRTVSLAALGATTRSYFYRVHIPCDDALSEAERTLYESAVIDLPHDPAA